MNRSEQLYAVSFRNVSFLCPSETTETGQKIAVHEYPKTNIRYVEALGTIPRKISMQCIIHGENFIQKRNEFERILLLPGLGELSHPIYGSIKVQVGSFKISSRDTEVGKSIFEVDFYVSEKEILPTFAQFDARSILDLTNEIKMDIDGLLDIEFVNPMDEFSLKKLADSILNMINSVESNFAMIESTIDGYKKNIFSIIQSATKFKNLLTNIFNTIAQLPMDFATLKEAWGNLMNFNLPQEKNTTVQRKNRNINSAIISDYTKLTATLGFVNAIVNIDFQTDDELIKDVQTMDKKIIQLLNSPDELLILLTPKIRSSMLQLRYSIKDIISSKAKNVFKVKKINSGKTSLSLLSYRYYANLNNISSLMSLNPNANSYGFNQEYKIMLK